MSKFKRARIVRKQTKRFVKRNWELILCGVLCTTMLTCGTIQASTSAEADMIDDYPETVATITETSTTTFVTSTTTTTTTKPVATTVAHGSSTARMSGTSTTTSTSVTTTNDDIVENVSQHVVRQEARVQSAPQTAPVSHDEVVVASDETETTVTNVPVVTETSIETTTIETQTTTTTTIEEVTEPPTETTVTRAISDEDYILMCNCVAHEAGANNISVYNKALVVEVVMNRVYDSRWPDTIRGVITQKNQFSGSSTYSNLSTYSSKVTDAVKEAVDLYFADPSQFNHGYTGFWGDGKQNHFR